MQISHTKMHSSYYNENFYDFTIDVNETVKLKENRRKRIPDKEKLFHNIEYLRAKEFLNLHKIYDDKFYEIFYVEKAPKDSLNRFLYEQLSIMKKSDDDDDDEYSIIQKPKNIYKLDTFKIEIISNYPLTKPMRLVKYLNKFKTLKDIKEYIDIANKYVKKVDENDERYLMRKIEDLDNYYKNAYKMEPLELHEKFETIYNKCLKIFKPIVKKKVSKLIDFMYDQIKITSKNVKKILKNSSSNDSSTDIEIDKCETIVSLKYKDLPPFKILKGHYDKLKTLYENTTIDREYDEKEFLSRVYCVICRYETFFRNSTLRNEGYGMQGAIPNYTFQELTKEFDVKQEMFASPLNCYFKTYCSAFFDTDSYFGSCGSFFTYEPIEGSFQCNPPFTEEVIERMADRIEYLLSNSELPLSFIVFIPEWLDPPTPGLVKMNKSKYKRDDFIVSSQKHKYVAGTQFLEQRGTLLYSAVHDSHVYFLQNKAGYEKWRPTREKIDKLKNVMESTFDSQKQAGTYDLRREVLDKIKSKIDDVRNQKRKNDDEIENDSKRLKIE
jgi:hypothetical protein